VQPKGCTHYTTMKILGIFKPDKTKVLAYLLSIIMVVIIEFLFYLPCLRHTSTLLEPYPPKRCSPGFFERDPTLNEKVLNFIFLPLVSFNEVNLISLLVTLIWTWFLFSIFWTISKTFVESCERSSVSSSERSE